MVSLQEDKKSLKGDIQQLNQELRRRDTTIVSLKTDIENLKREIGERDETIQDKVGWLIEVHARSGVKHTTLRWL